MVTPPRRCAQLAAAPGQRAALWGTWPNLATLGRGIRNQAANADTDSSLQVTNLPANLKGSGGFIYVTEVFANHPLITPFDRLGITLPKTLKSIAYF